MPLLRPRHFGCGWAVIDEIAEHRGDLARDVHHALVLDFCSNVENAVILVGFVKGTDFVAKALAVADSLVQPRRHAVVEHA